MAITVAFVASLLVVGAGTLIVRSAFEVRTWPNASGLGITGNSALAAAACGLIAVLVGLILFFAVIGQLSR